MRRVLSILLAVVIIVSILPVASADQPKLVALTFDDGPGPYTAKLLDGLKERGIHATFFCQGSRAEVYPELIKRIVAEGHQLANHSYNHPNLNELSLQNALYQVSRTEQIFNELIGGSESYYLRPPYGNTTQQIRNELQVPVVIWSVDTIDWQLLNREAVKNKILHDTFDGSIVLMHDIHYTTVDAILDALDTLEARGYEFVTVKELYYRRGVTPDRGVQLYDCRPNGTDRGSLSVPEMSVSGDAEMLSISFESKEGAPIYYTTDGSELLPGNGILYTEPFSVSLPCSIRAVAAWDLNGNRSQALTASYTLPPTGEVLISSENGKIVFTTASEADTVYVSLELDGVVSDAAEVHQTDIPRDTYFWYYADAEGYTPTESKRLLYTVNGNLFSDVDNTDWFYHGMDHCVSNGYFQVVSDFSLNPTGKVTRAMLVELLYRQAGCPIGMHEEPFLDVAETAYYHQSVSWAYELGIIQGTGDGYFEPDRMVSRQELAKILSVYLQLPHEAPIAAYLDEEDIAAWAIPYVEAVTASGIMQGSSGIFRPLGTASRAEIAELLMRIDSIQQ